MFAAVSTIHAMSTAFCTVVVLVVILLPAVSAATAVEVSKIVLSLGSGVFVARPLFFGIGSTLITAHFLAWSSSVLA